MLLDLQQPLLAGDELALTLHFQEAGALETSVPIRAPFSE
jgi:copper(I)-binding protein